MDSVRTVTRLEKGSLGMSRSVEKKPKLIIGTDGARKSIRKSCP
jgi:hypothetical protein